MEQIPQSYRRQEDKQEVKLEQKERLRAEDRRKRRGESVWGNFLGECCGEENIGENISKYEFLTVYSIKADPKTITRSRL